MVAASIIRKGTKSVPEEASIDALHELKELVRRNDDGAILSFITNPQNETLVKGLAYKEGARGFSVTVSDKRLVVYTVDGKKTLATLNLIGDESPASELQLHPNTARNGSGNIDFTVVLVSPKEDGNVGAIARLMRNFGFYSLFIVSPRAPLASEARRRAMEGLDILKKARVVSSLGQALADQDIVVGTSDQGVGKTRSYLRRSATSAEFIRDMPAFKGKIAIVFGPEDNGLCSDEIALCDALVTIPASKEFPSMNLSHAAAVILHDIYAATTELLRK